MIYKCIEVITNTQPRGFLIENVVGLKRHHPECLSEIEALLRRSSPVGYLVSTQIVNSRHFGVPQNRERLYIVGQRCDCVFKQFTWPTGVPAATNLRDILLKPCEVDDATKTSDWQPRMLHFILKGREKLAAKGIDIDTEPCCIDVRRSPAFGLSITHGYSPCLTFSRAKSGGFYITSEQRVLDIKEMCRLQGFSDTQFAYEAAWGDVPRNVATSRELTEC